MLGLYENAFRFKAKRLSFSILSTSLAVTKEILVSFYFYAALTNMLKFSAYTRLG
jgi:hypothetical protein